MRKIALVVCLILLFTALPVSTEVFMEKVPEDWADKATLTIIAFKVGRSDSMLVSCGGEYMLVDGGYNAYRVKLADALAAMGLDHVKYLFNTHPHDDHLMGFLYLLENGFTADEALSPFREDYPDKYGFQQKLVARLKKAEIPYRQVYDGDVISLGDAVITVMHNAQGATMNDRSAVLNIRFGDSSALLTADIPGDTQKYFVKNADPALLKADVLKAPHHGINAMVTEFLDTVSPAFLFGSCFEKNATKIIAQARKRDIPVYCAGQGRITMVTDGTDWYIWQDKGEF